MLNSAPVSNGVNNSSGEARERPKLVHAPLQPAYIVDH